MNDALKNNPINTNAEQGKHIPLRLPLSLEE